MLLYICISIIFISVLFSFHSFKKNRLSLFLSTYFIILATYGLTHYFIAYQKSDFWLAVFFNHFSPLWVIAGPCLYLYVQSALLNTSRLSSKNWIHALPLFIYAVSVSPYFLRPFSEKIAIAHQIHINIHALKSVQTNLFFKPEINFIVRASLFLIYSICSLILYLSYVKKNKIDAGDNKKIIRRWLLILILISVTMAISFLIATFIFLYNPISEYQIFHHPLLLIILISFLILAISLFFFPQILYGLTKNINEPAIHKQETLIVKNKLQVEEITIEENEWLKELSIRINEYLRKEKPYLSKDFSMHDIAVAMDVPNHHISFCLNQVMNTSFANLKNQLRVEHSITLLKQNEASSLSIEGIAQNSGFATRSSFYTAFKKVTGTTPTEYLNHDLTSHSPMTND